MAIEGIDDFGPRNARMKQKAYAGISGLGDAGPSVLGTSVHVVPWKAPSAGKPITIGGWFFTGQGAVPPGVGALIHVVGPNSDKTMKVVTDSSGSFQFPLDKSFHPVDGEYEMFISMNPNASVTLNDITYAPGADGSSNYDSGMYSVRGSNAFDDLIADLKKILGIK